MKWSFGKNLEKSELRFGYIMKVRRKGSTHRTYVPIHIVCHCPFALRCTSSFVANQAPMQTRKLPLNGNITVLHTTSSLCLTITLNVVCTLSLSGHACRGIYQPITSATVLNFHLKTSSVVITYRILDQNSTHTRTLTTRAKFYKLALT